MKTFSLILAFLILMIDESKQFGQVQHHQQNLKMSNMFPANDRVKQKGRKLMWLACHKKSYLICDEITNF